MAKSSRAQYSKMVAMKGKRSRPGWMTIPLLVFLIALMLAFYDTILIMISGMAPTLVARFVDEDRNRYLSRTVGWMNGAGVLVVLMKFWSGDVSLDGAFAILINPFNWLIMLGGAAVGWLIFLFVPELVKNYLDLSFDRRLKTEEKIQRDLEKEWGTEVAEKSDRIALADAKARADAFMAEQKMLQNGMAANGEAANGEGANTEANGEKAPDSDGDAGAGQEKTGTG